MSNSIPFENFESFDQQTLLDFSYLAIIPVRFLIMPKHLELTERPELNDFPANILFAETFDDPRKLEIRGALYEPDLATYEVKNGQKQMLYRNAHGGDSQVRVFREPDGGYTGVRIIQGADKSFTMGATWKDFFLHLTLAGIFQEEAFVPVPISSINEAFPPKPHHKILTHEVPEDRVKADRKEVVEYREKAKKEPDLFLPKLARSLSNLGLSLSGLGQKDEAFKVTVEAVEISRCLNEDPPLNRPVLLGVNLNNLGNRLYEQGKVKEALEPTREAEIIFRELTTKYDGNSKADLARSLWDIGLYLNELGQHEDGLNTTLESVELSRQLVKQNPERFNAYLTSGLNILGKIYSDLELNEEALKATQESEEINKTSGDSKIIHSKPKPETKIDVGAMTIQEIKPQNEIEKYLEDSSIRKGGNPSFVIMMGTVGAGKTTIRRKEYAKGYVNLDAGDIFANLAKGEYLDFPGELEIPLEMVGRMLAKEAIRQKRNMVVEVIGDSTEDTEAMAKVMVTAGYEIVPVLVKCEVKEGYLRHTKAVATDPKNISAYFTQDYHKKWILNAVKGVE